MKNRRRRENLALVCGLPGPSRVVLPQAAHMTGICAGTARGARPGQAFLTQQPVHMVIFSLTSYLAVWGKARDQVEGIRIFSLNLDDSTTVGQGKSKASLDPRQERTLLRSATCL